MKTIQIKINAGDKHCGECNLIREEDNPCNYGYFCKLFGVKLKKPEGIILKVGDIALLRAEKCLNSETPDIGVPKK